MENTKALSFKINSNRKVSFAMKFKKKESVKVKFHFQHSYPAGTKKFLNQRV